MNTRAQTGFSLPEMLLAIIAAALIIGALAQTFDARLNVAHVREQQSEIQYIATLVERAHRRGWLAADAGSADDLQAALPGQSVPARLRTGREYHIAADRNDPRVRASIEINARTAADRAEVARAPLRAADLRIPFWRARQLRQIQEQQP